MAETYVMYWLTVKTSTTPAGIGIPLVVAATVLPPKVIKAVLDPVLVTITCAPELLAGVKVKPSAVAAEAALVTEIETVAPGESGVTVCRPGTCCARTGVQDSSTSSKTRIFFIVFPTD